jgi:RES domain-containing protein
MTPLPGALGGTELVAWRLDQAKHASAWDSGEGAYLAGGRWNSSGVRALYCSVDPATAILEMAVHKGFSALDTVPHVLTAITIDPKSVFVIDPSAIPNPNWLRPGIPSGGQQAFGDDLLSRHKIVLIPSVVSTASWNLMFVASNAAGAYQMKLQERFALDPRLHPPANPGRAVP